MAIIIPDFHSASTSRRRLRLIERQKTIHLRQGFGGQRKEKDKSGRLETR